MKYVVLFLTDLLDPKAPDFEYTKEYQAAKKYFPVGLIDQQKLRNEGKKTNKRKQNNNSNTCQLTLGFLCQG